MIDKIKDKTYAAIIVGAGPAGVSLAYYLSQYDIEVLLVDKSKFPRDKICGDGLSASTLSILDDMGVLENIEVKDLFKIYHVTVFAPNGNSMKGKIPAVQGHRDYGYVLPRQDFDNILFKHIQKKQNITILQDFLVTDLLYDNEKIVGVKGTHKGKEYQVHGSYIIGADGVHSKIAGSLGLKNKDPRHTAFAVRAYFDNVSNLDSSINIYFDEKLMPGYAWIFPMSENTANVGAGILLEHIKEKNVKKIFNYFIENNNLTREIFKNAKMRKNTLKGWPLTLGSYSGKRGKDNVLLIGDAGSFIDTFTGEGIYYALKTGKFASEVIASAIKGSRDNVAGIYEKLWRKELWIKEFKTGALLQKFMKYKHVTNFVINRAGKNQKKADILAGVIEHVLPKKKAIF